MTMIMNVYHVDIQHTNAGIKPITAIEDFVQDAIVSGQNLDEVMKW